jgi:hypothetical protein
MDSRLSDWYTGDEEIPFGIGIYNPDPLTANTPYYFKLWGASDYGNSGLISKYKVRAVRGYEYYPASTVGWANAIFNEDHEHQYVTTIKNFAYYPNRNDMTAMSNKRTPEGITWSR